MEMKSSTTNQRDPNPGPTANPPENCPIDDVIVEQSPVCMTGFAPCTFIIIQPK